MNKPQVAVTYEGLKTLLVAAKQADTVHHWTVLALEWAAKANDEIVRLRKVDTVAAERLCEFIRAHTSGGCKMLSMGDACVCPLCDVGRLTDR